MSVEVFEPPELADEDDWSVLAGVPPDEVLDELLAVELVDEAVPPSSVVASVSVSSVRASSELSTTASPAV